MRIPTAIVGILLYYLFLYWIRDSKVIQYLILKKVLEIAAVYPRTESLQITDSLIKIYKLDDFNKENIEIKKKLYDKIYPVIEILKSYSNDFMLDQVDGIIINNMDVELLIVENRPSKKGRSLSIDLTRVRTQYIKYTNFYIFCMIILTIFGIFVQVSILILICKKKWVVNDNVKKKKKFFFFLRCCNTNYYKDYK